MMDKVRMLQELKAMQSATQALHQKLVWLILELEQEDPETGGEQESLSQLLEDIYPLTKTPSFFKGRRPVAVIFPDGARIKATSWKGVVEALLKDCDQNQGMHDSLMALRNRVYGSSRVILGDNKEEMKSPIEVCPGLYVESHYDAESLLRITFSRILSVVGYDYSNIKVAVRKTNS